MSSLPSIKAAAGHLCIFTPSHPDGVFFSQKLQQEVNTMEFFNSAIDVLQTLVTTIGAGLAVWGAINLLEGYGNDNPGANAHVR
jgi:hypothetical protein